MPVRTVTLATMVLGALALSGCGQEAARTSSDVRPLPIEPYSAKAERRDIVGLEVLSAKLVVPPASIAKVHPPYRAPLKRVLVTVGKRVRRGEVLMELDLPDQEAQHDSSRMTVQAAEQAYAGARLTLRAPVKDAESRLAEARSTERTLRSQIDPSGDATALVNATAARKAAEAEVQRVNSEYQAALRPYALELEQARAMERTSREGVKQGSVRAPISGTVVELQAQAGGEVGADQREVLATIVDLDELKIRAEVPANLTSQVDRGDEVVVTFREISDQRFTGTVRGLRTLPDAGGRSKAEAEIELRNTQGLVKPDMTPDRVAIVTQKVMQAIAVPSQAVDQDETGRPIVRVLVGSDWKVRVVEVGIDDGTWTQITRGVEVGDTVQVTPAR